MADVDQLKRRIARLILEDRPFSSNDVTADGNLALDPAHEANAKQNGIGGLMGSLAGSGYIRFTGQVAYSTAPHRKRGMVRVWVGTPRGRSWARSILGNLPPRG